MRRTGQGGAILGFIIGAMILAFLLIGGVYLMNQQSDRTRPAPVEVPEPQHPTPASEPNQPESHPQSAGPSSETPTQLPSQATPHEIPQTGPRETLGVGVVFAILGGTAIAYVRSCRQFSSL